MSTDDTNISQSIKRLNRFRETNQFIIYWGINTIKNKTMCFFILGIIYIRNYIYYYYINLFILIISLKSLE